MLFVTLVFIFLWLVLSYPIAWAGLCKTACGFAWSYCEDWDANEFEPVEENRRPVVVTTPDNNEIHCNSVREAARLVGISPGHVTECCQNKRKSRNGHKFRYVD